MVLSTSNAEKCTLSGPSRPAGLPIQINLPAGREFCPFWAIEYAPRPQVPYWLISNVISPSEHNTNQLSNTVIQQVDRHKYAHSPQTYEPKFFDLYSVGVLNIGIGRANSSSTKHTNGQRSAPPCGNYSVPILRN